MGQVGVQSTRRSKSYPSGRTWSQERRRSVQRFGMSSWSFVVVILLYTTPLLRQMQIGERRGLAVPPFPSCRSKAESRIRVFLSLPLVHPVSSDHEDDVGGVE